MSCMSPCSLPFDCLSNSFVHHCSTANQGDCNGNVTAPSHLAAGQKHLLEKFKLPPSGIASHAVPIKLTFGGINRQFSSRSTPSQKNHLPSKVSFPSLSNMSMQPSCRDSALSFELWAKSQHKTDLDYMGGKGYCGLCWVSLCSDISTSWEVANTAYNHFPLQSPAKCSTEKPRVVVHFVDFAC